MVLACSMMTPSYDVIVDNPKETADDIAATVNLLHSLPRPFILNVFPLMRIPSTELAEIADRENLALPLINQGQLAPSLANALILSSMLVRLPRRLLGFLSGMPGQDRCRLEGLSDRL